MKLRDFTAVFFDWDGTLVESLTFLHTAHNHVREKLGHPCWSLEEFKGMMKYSSRQLYPQIYGDRAQEGMDILKAFMDSEHLKYIEHSEGADALLEYLNSINMPMGVVSNKRHIFIEREVEHTGWGPYFRVILGAGEAANDKPSADPLLLALERANLKPGEHVLFVGDTISDLECAANAGCTQAFLYHTNPDNPLIEQYKPAIIAKNCGALLKLML